MALCAAAICAPRAVRARAALPALWRRISSISAGSVASPSAAIGDVDLGVVAEVVDVVALREVLGANAYGFAARSTNAAHGGRHVVELEADDHVGSILGAARAVQRVPRREVLPRGVPAHVHGRLQQFRELDESVPAGGRARELAGTNQRSLRRRKQPRGLANGAGVALRKARHDQTRHGELARIGNGFFLQLRVDDEQRGAHRRCAADRVRAHRDVREHVEIRRLVVHLHEVAHDRAHVLRAVRPIDDARRVAGVTDDGEHGNAVAPRLEQAHRRVQQADRAVHQRHHRLAGRLGVAVCDGRAGFFVQHGQDLGLAVAAVVDQGLVDAFEGRAGVHGHVVEVERLEDVDHVIRGRMLNEPCIDARLRRDEIGAAVRLRRSSDARARGGWRGLLRRAGSGDDRAGGAGSACGCPLQKFATID